MSRDDLISIEGEITDALAGGNYTVKLANNQTISAKLSGKMKKFYIKVIVGDKVTVGLSPYDLTHGLITFRHKPGGPRISEQATAFAANNENKPEDSGSSS